MSKIESYTLLYYVKSKYVKDEILKVIDEIKVLGVYSNYNYIIYYSQMIKKIKVFVKLMKLCFTSLSLSIN